MSQWMYYLSRSTGIVALLLVVAALLWGFLFSSRATGKHLRPNWWLDLHNWLGGLALVFTGLHLVTVWLNSDAAIGEVGRGLGVTGLGRVDHVAVHRWLRPSRRRRRSRHRRCRRR